MNVGAIRPASIAARALLAPALGPPAHPRPDAHAVNASARRPLRSPAARAPAPDSRPPLARGPCMAARARAATLSIPRGPCASMSANDRHAVDIEGWRVREFDAGKLRRSIVQGERCPRSNLPTKRYLCDSDWHPHDDVPPRRKLRGSAPDTTPVIEGSTRRTLDGWTCAENPPSPRVHGRIQFNEWAPANTSVTARVLEARARAIARYGRNLDAPGGGDAEAPGYINPRGYADQFWHSSDSEGPDEEGFSRSLCERQRVFLRTFPRYQEINGEAPAGGQTSSAAREGGA